MGATESLLDRTVSRYIYKKQKQLIYWLDIAVLQPNFHTKKTTEINRNHEIQKDEIDRKKNQVHVHESNRC